LKRWSLTSNVTPTPKSDSDSPPRLTYPSIFFRLSTAILTFLEAVEPNLQRHPYAIRFRFLFSPFLLQRFFPPLYHHFNFSRCGGALSPTSPLHQHQIQIPLLPLPTSTFFPTFLPPF